ncbi:methyltransferase family protein [Rhodococcus opacus]|uniref:methyltransferase family protein n=1 Tax=Rhodococcus opacus TaxID=37919 RepID=UPI003D7A6623
MLPYAFSRNPMFLGQVTIWAGWAVFMGSLPVAVGLASFIGVWIVGSPFEERGLRERFGAEYDAYRGRVPRLVHLGSTRGIPPTERRWTRGSGTRTIPDPHRDGSPWLWW